MNNQSKHKRPTVDEYAELIKLRKENQHLRMELETLKKTSVFFAEEKLRPFINSLEQRVAKRTAELEAEKQALAVHKEVLAELSSRLQIIFETASDGIHILDQDGKVIQCSNSFAHMLGYSVAEAQQLNVADWDAKIPKDELKPAIQSLIKAANTFETRHRRKDGSEFDVEINAKAIDIAGKCYLYASSRDITGRKRIEATLKASNDRLEAAASAGIIGVWDWDIVNNNLFWDSVMYQLYGIQAENFSGAYEAWENAVHPDDMQQALASLAAAMSGQAEYSPEFRIIRPDGAVCYIKAIAKTTFDGTGKALRMIGVNYDITGHKQLEHALRASLQDNQAILNSRVAGFWVTTPQRTIKWVNQTAANALGYEPEELIGQSTLVCYPDEESYRQFGRMRQEAFMQGMEFHIQYQWRHKNASLRWFNITAAPLSSDPDSTIWISVDIDASKQAEAQLLLAKQTAEQANEAKSLFLATMSHEIRTPLNAIVGMSYLLGLSALDTEQQEEVQVIESSSKNLLALINDILDFSKIEAGEFELDHHPFVLINILNNVRAMFSGMASQKAIQFYINAPAAKLPAVVVADANRLTQILINLLSNALKFTAPGGRVSLNVQQLGKDTLTHSVHLRFIVSDSGIGIAPEVQAKLFTPFIQADAAINRKYGGTGLGLAIVKKLTNLMGGKVGVDSRAGEGSTFWLDIPLLLPTPEHSLLCPDNLPDQSVANQPNLDLTGIRVLAVDDSLINLEVIKRILSKAGVLVTVCTSGRDALDSLRQCRDGYDLVLIDIQMPELDGIETTRVIRRELKPDQLPIIALTAGATTRQRQLAEAVGINDFLLKPVDPLKLLSVLRSHVDCDKRRSPSASTGIVQTSCEAPIDINNWPLMLGIDIAQAQLLTGHDLAFYIELLDMFLVENQPVVERIVALLHAQQTLTAAKLVHKLRGQAANIGASVLAHAAEQLEHGLNEDAADIELRLATLITQHGALMTAIRQVLKKG